MHFQCTVKEESSDQFKLDQLNITFITFFERPLRTGNYIQTSIHGVAKIAQNSVFIFNAWFQLQSLR